MSAQPKARVESRAFVTWDVAEAEAWYQKLLKRIKAGREVEYEMPGATMYLEVLHLRADLAAAQATNEELKSELEDVIRVTKKTDEEVEKAHRFALEKERASRLLADDTLLKAQNNALKFMNRVKQLEHAIEQAAQIAERQPCPPSRHPFKHTDMQHKWVKEQIAAKIRALAQDEAGG